MNGKVNYFFFFWGRLIFCKIHMSRPCLYDMQLPRYNVPNIIICMRNRNSRCATSYFPPCNYTTSYQVGRNVAKKCHTLLLIANNSLSKCESLVQLRRPYPVTEKRQGKRTIFSDLKEEIWLKSTQIFLSAEQKKVQPLPSIKKTYIY